MEVDEIYQKAEPSPPKKGNQEQKDQDLTREQSPKITKRRAGGGAGGRGGDSNRVTSQPSWSV